MKPGQTPSLGHSSQKIAPIVLEKCIHNNRLKQGTQNLLRAVSCLFLGNNEFSIVNIKHTFFKVFLKREKRSILLMKKLC